jgi:hypothetical protein
MELEICHGNSEIFWSVINLANLTLSNSLAIRLQKKSGGSHLDEAPTERKN